ncbi:MAG: ribokinase [Spirochaetes bacterium]|nr:ribokinase [Spirochaetota bacterium]
MSSSFCVIGSINMDLVAQVDRFPRPGETRTGTAFGTYPGGKGANQAVALARLGARVLMAGKIGDDVFGSSYQRTFEAEGVDTTEIEVVPRTSTGVAVIEVDAAGENHIVIVPGANGLVDRGYVNAHLDALAGADYALFQLETPFDTVGYAMAQATERGVVTILDPAPAPPDGLDRGLLENAAYITPNESEAETLTGIAVTDEDSAAHAGARLRELGARTVIIKAGAGGAYIVEQAGTRVVAGFGVEVADTTAAGDAFNAGLAAALGDGLDLDMAVRFANAVGAMACTGMGAQSAMPNRAAVRELLQD